MDRVETMLEEARKLDRSVTVMSVAIYFALGVILALTLWA